MRSPAYGANRPADVSAPVEASARSWGCGAKTITAWLQRGCVATLLARASKEFAVFVALMSALLLAAVESAPQSAVAPSAAPAAPTAAESAAAPKKPDGSEKVCWEEHPTGSHLSKTICATRDQLERERQEANESLSGRLSTPRSKGLSPS
jgi:hypothetical protein